jgi:hypothetical protein
MIKCMAIVGLIIVLVLPQIGAITTSESWLDITLPQPGLYYRGEKLLDAKVYIFIGSHNLEVATDTSGNIITVFFSLYNVREKEIIHSVWDIDGSDGFSCYFNDLSLGMYAIAAIGTALDIEEPIAFDWILPVIILA